MRTGFLISERCSELAGGLYKHMIRWNRLYTFCDGSQRDLYEIIFFYSYHIPELPLIYHINGLRAKLGPQYLIEMGRRAASLEVSYHDGARLDAGQPLQAIAQHKAHPSKPHGV